jgi:hypothetical protein
MMVAKSLLRVRKGWVLAAAAMALVVVAPTLVRAQVPAAVQAAVSDVRARFAGTFTPISVPFNQAMIETAIDRTVAPLIIIAQPIARSRLRAANPVFHAIAIRFTEGQIEVDANPMTVRTRDDGTEGSAIGLNNRPNHVMQRMQNDQLLQNMWTEEGARHTVFHASPDGRLLRVHVTITSPRLSVPLDYEMVYRR